MPVVAVFNQKGGVGKTTTTLNLAAAFAAHSQGAGDYRALTEEPEESNFFASPAPVAARAAQGG